MNDFSQRTVNFPKKMLYISKKTVYFQAVYFPDRGLYQLINFNLLKIDSKRCYHFIGWLSKDNVLIGRERQLVNIKINFILGQIIYLNMKFIDEGS